MSGELAGNGDDDGVLVSGQIVPMQLIQQIYSEVTGKSEKIAKSFEINHRTTFGDLENLNYKVEQMLEQYHVKEKNCSVIFFHIDECSERFSSFDRAKIYESGSASPIENVRIEYNFLIVLPIVQKPQAYKITVDIISKAAVFEKLKEKNLLHKKIMSIFASETGAISVEYIDYAVARNFMVAISQWFDALDNHKASKVLLFLKKYARYLSFTMRIVTSLIIFLFFYFQSPQFESLMHLFQYSFVALVVFSLAAQIAYQIGSSIEESIDEIHPMSCMNLNRGDKNLMSEIRGNNKKKVFSAVLGGAFAVGLNVLAAWVAIEIGIGEK